MTEAEDPAGGTGTSPVIALRLGAGWISVAIGVLDLVVELAGGAPPDVTYVLFHVTLLVGGIMLLALGWVGPRPGAIGYAAGGAALVGGMVISAFAGGAACCMPAFGVRHGFPFAFLARDPGQGWHVDAGHALIDGVFWAYLGLLVLVAVAVFRPQAGPVGPAPAEAGLENPDAVEAAEESAPQHDERQYIEHPIPDEAAARRRTVRPLP